MQTNRWTLPLGAVLAAGVLGLAPAQAAVITGLFNTGVGADHLALAGGDGVTDTHWLVESTAPGFTPRQAVTYTHPAYLPNGADSRWVSLSATGDLPGGSGTLTTFYSLTFDLTGLDPATAVLSGKAGADNLGNIYLNNSYTGKSFQGFGGLSEFTLSSGFRAGLNTLMFQITDQGAPTAFRVGDLFGTAAVLVPPDPGPGAPIPEPATWAMMLAGFFGMGGVLRHRRRTALA